MSFLALHELKAAYAAYLTRFYHFTRKETERALTGFPNPFSDPYLTEIYVGEVSAEGDTYEQYLNILDLQSVENPTVPAFRFYIFYRLQDIPNRTVLEYRRAEKLYAPYWSICS